MASIPKACRTPEIWEVSSTQRHVEPEPSWRLTDVAAAWFPEMNEENRTTVNCLDDAPSLFCPPQSFLRCQCSFFYHFGDTACQSRGFSHLRPILIEVTSFQPQPHHGGGTDRLSLTVSLTAGGESSLDINLSQLAHSPSWGCGENDQCLPTRLLCSVNHREREITKSPFKYLRPLHSLLLSHRLALKISTDVSTNGNLREMPSKAKNTISRANPGKLPENKALCIFRRGCLSIVIAWAASCSIGWKAGPGTNETERLAGHYGAPTGARRQKFIC